MPTALMLNGFRFFFYSNENDEPLHVHVEKGGGFGKIWLQPVIQPAYFCHFSASEERMIMEIVQQYTPALIDKWHEHFG